MCKAIAVYGTLRYGGPANGLMRGAKYLGQDAVYGKLHSLGDFPGLKLREEGEGFQVVVDVYEMPPEVEPVLLMSLDKYEGYYPNEPDQSLYSRVKVLTVEGNMEVWVYAYKFPAPESSFIESGDWFQHAYQ